MRKAESKAETQQAETAERAAPARTVQVKLEEFLRGKGGQTGCKRRNMKRRA